MQENVAANQHNERLQAELTDLKQNYLEQMTAVKDTHLKLMEERKQIEEYSRDLMSQSIKLDDERNKLWMSHLL